LKDIEQKVYKNLESSIKIINDGFLCLRNKFSPKVSVIQRHMEINMEKEEKDKYVENNGFINSHLCVNAQTNLEHTEPDSSYTIICVPNQTERATLSGHTNVGRFELVVNENNTIVIPMNAGCIFTYSPYMLTHRQQIKNENDKMDPLINIVSYNSKRLFSNLMESFRRDIKADKKKYFAKTIY